MQEAHEPRLAAAVDGREHAHPLRQQLERPLPVRQCHAAFCGGEVVHQLHFQVEQEVVVGRK